MAELMSGSRIAEDAMLESVLIATKTVSYCFLSFSILDWANTLQYEREHIWTKRSCKVKWQYLWSRYIGLLGQILNVVAVNRLYVSTSVPWRICYSWYIVQLISGHSIFMMLEFTSAIRVVALYDRTWRIYLGVGGLLTTEFVINTVISFWIFNKVVISGSCGLQDTPILITIVPISKAVTQIILWTLALLKCQKQEAPLVTLIMRDGSLSFVSVTIVLVATAIQFSLAAFGHVHAEQAYHLLFPIFLFTMATTNCRIIKNMEIYARTQASGPTNGETLDPTILLTTIISEYQSTSEASDIQKRLSESADSTTLTRRTSPSSKFSG